MHFIAGSGMLINLKQTVPQVLGTQNLIGSLIGNHTYFCWVAGQEPRTDIFLISSSVRTAWHSIFVPLLGASCLAVDAHKKKLLYQQLSLSQVSSLLHETTTLHA